MAVVIHAQPWEINQRLLDLGIPSVDILLNAIKAGHTARVFCTSNDPPFIHGTEAWRMTLRMMREGLILTRAGWRVDEIGNFSVTVNDKIGINIVVATGDEVAGRNLGPAIQPQTRSLKGLYTEAAIQRNVVEGDLFPDSIPETIVRKARILHYPTWTLLIYTTRGEARGELSYAAEIEDGEITEWRERILLPEIDIDPTFKEESNDSGPDFDIDVTLKA